jgi:Domain of unknown function (DUF4249)
MNTSNNISKSFFISRIFSLIMIAMLLSGCEKVIDIDIEDSEKKLVIEGSVDNILSSAATVKISSTKSFDEETTFSGISGAEVYITVNNADQYRLNETAPGIYQSTEVEGIPGFSYALKVRFEGQEYAAVSVMPIEIVPLDTLTVETLSFGGSNDLTIQPSYLDPAGTGNSYRFIQYANGALVKNVFVQNDDISDGLRITRPLINRNGDLQSGDFVKVDMLCIDKNVYRYWYSLAEAATGENQSATPANPVSNISGGVLGYFSAHSISTKSIIIP